MKKFIAHPEELLYVFRHLKQQLYLCEFIYVS